MIIYSVSRNAEGIDRFINLIRQSGNVGSIDPDTDMFEVYSRYKDDHYGPSYDVVVIRNEEIGKAVAEIEDLNTPERLTGARRAASLSDILSARKLDIIPTAAVAKPYHNPDEEFADEGEPEIDENNEDFTESEMEGEEDMDEFRTEEENHNVDQTTEQELNHYEKDGEYGQANAPPALQALYEAAQTISNAKRDRILKVVQETLGNDLTDVSDILLMLSETAELKKALSAILALLSIEVSMSAVSRDYKVQPKVLRFAADRSESLENYRRGVAQVMIQIREILADKEKTAELETSLKTAESNLEAEKRNAAIAASRHEDEVKTLKSLLSPPALMSARFLVFWEKDGDTIYLSVEANAPNAAITEANKNQNPPPPFEAATKRCAAVMKQNQAYKFMSLESAQAQVMRLTKFASNCAFFDGEKPKLMIARLGLDIVG